jgi:hypothetical protein
LFIYVSGASSLPPRYPKKSIGYKKLKVLSLEGVLHKLRGRKQRIFIMSPFGGGVARTTREETKDFHYVPLWRGWREVTGEDKDIMWRVLFAAF